jgi:hypothetical protein
MATLRRAAEPDQPPARAIPYEHVRQKKIELPPRQERAYARAPIEGQTFVPTRHVVE